MYLYRVNSQSDKSLASVFVVCVLTWLIITPRLSIAQCRPDDPTTAKVSPPLSGASIPQFYDEPQFTVAGVADATNLGGHGSDTVLRTKETLAKDTVSLGEKQRALELSTTSLGATEKSLREAIERHPEDAGLHHSLGDVEEKLKHPLEAVREYQRAVELNPSEPYLFDWGAELLAHRAPEAALEVFTKGNRLFPTSVRMLVGMGVAWHARGSYDRAGDCLCAASDLNPSDPAPYSFLARMYSAGTIQSSGVVERLERFARLRPEIALANYYYASALWTRAKGRADAPLTARVQSLLEKAVHLDSTLGVAYLQVGIVDSDGGDWPRAISAYKQAIAVSPQLEEAHYRLAQAYRRAGEKAKAEQELRLYEQLSKSAAEQTDRERHEIQQFIVELRDSQNAPLVPEKQKR